MVAPEQVEQLKQGLQRAFALPLSKMTFREVQNAVALIFPNQSEVANKVMESLVKGELSTSMQAPKLKEVIQEYAPLMRFAKEVADYGEFMNSFTCDFISQGNQVFFINRMRRIDGEEYHFLSAPETNIRLAHMFINRLRDLKKNVGGISLDKSVVEELNNLAEDIKDLVG